MNPEWRGPRSGSRHLLNIGAGLSHGPLLTNVGEPPPALTRVQLVIGHAPTGAHPSPACDWTCSHWHSPESSLYLETPSKMPSASHGTRGTPWTVQRMDMTPSEDCQIRRTSR